jgi:cytochrome c
MVDIRPTALLLCALMSAAAAQASAQLALDKGCFACHGNPPRKNAPTFETLALDYAGYQGQTDMEISLADKLRARHIFGGIQAHEQLSEDSARALVRWIIQGAN